jgi:hypothetical protein
MLNTIQKLLLFYYRTLTHLKIFLLHNKKDLAIKAQIILKSLKVILNYHKIFFQYTLPILSFSLHLRWMPLHFTCFLTCTVVHFSAWQIIFNFTTPYCGQNLIFIDKHNLLFQYTVWMATVFYYYNIPFEWQIIVSSFLTAAYNIISAIMLVH